MRSSPQAKSLRPSNVSYACRKEKEDRLDLAYTAFQRAFLKETGLDLTSYKQRQMQRRIDQWMNRHGLNSYNDLIKLIQEDPEKRGGILRLSNHQHFPVFPGQESF